MITPTLMYRSWEIFGLSMMVIFSEMKSKLLFSGKVCASVEMMDAMPRARNIDAREAMNGCMLNSSMSTPVSRPNTTPMRIMAIIAMGAAMPAFVILTPITAVMATMAPTDRSMPPVSTGSVMATASMIRYAWSMNSDETNPSRR